MCFASRRAIDGVLLLDKPAGLTSNRALQVTRRLLEAQKAGHSGTLDPMATGLLPICCGEASKFASELSSAGKMYRAEIRLGVTTDTQDATGQVLQRQEVKVSATQVQAILNELTGEIEQVPPMYSAVKKDGRRLYQYARQNIEVPRLPRRVHIHHIQLDEWLAADCFRITVHSGKGVYIRTLAHDLGVRLGCGAHLCALRRLMVGPFQVAHAVSLAALDNSSMEGRLQRLLPVDSLLWALDALHLLKQQADQVRQGQRPQLNPLIPVPKTRRLRLYDENCRLIGVGEISADGRLVPVRLLRN